MKNKRKSRPEKPAANNIKALRDARGLTQVQLAELAGMGKGEVSKIETGYRNKRGTAETHRKLANALGVTIDELGIGIPPDDVAFEQNAKPGQQPQYRVPVRAIVKAGIADEAIENLVEPIGWEWTSEKPKDNRDVIQVSGDSMEPYFSDGDRIVVERGLEPRSGDVVVAEFHPNGDEQRLTTIKVYGRDDGMAILYPLNRRYRDTPMDSRWKITAVAVKHICRAMRGRYIDRVIKTKC